MGQDDENIRWARDAAKGDQAAFAILVRRNQSQLRGFLMRMTKGDSALADDLAQETFLEAFRKIRQFGKGSFFGWLCSIAYSRFLMERRKKRPEAMDEDTERTLEDDAPEAERTTMAKLDLERAMAQLPDVQRAALTLSFALGMTNEEAAAAMDIPVGTLKSHIHRGRETLQTILTGWQSQQKYARMA